MYRDSDIRGGSDPDFYMYRNQAYITEKAHNPYHPNLNLSSDLYFENQFTQQAEVYDEPGLFLGRVDPQAMLALQNTREITIRWEADRAPEFPSPFWHAKFLSVWNPTTNEFEVQDPGFTYNVYFQKVGTLALEPGTLGGPYFPLSLYTLENPNDAIGATFLNFANLEDVQDPKSGELCPLNNPDVSIRVGQVAVSNTTNLDIVSTLNLPALAPSDQDSFRVSTYDAASGTTGSTIVYDRSSPAPVPRYKVPNPLGDAIRRFTSPTGPGAASPWSRPTRPWRGGNRPFRGNEP